MRIPNLYEDNRVDGKTALRQCQLVQLHLLKVLKKICDDHGIRLWLCGGTLLGAMRHQGFIPWDDDLDVMMLKSDYKQFLRWAKEELPEDVFLDLPEHDEAFREENSITRLRDNYSMGLLRHNKRLLINDHHGIQIEIFLLEECWGKSRLMASILHTYLSNRGWYRRAFFDKVTLWNLVRKWAMGVWVKTTGALWCFLQSLPVRKRYLLATNFYVAWKMWLPKEWFIQSGRAERTARFEDCEMPIPYETEEYLEFEYGDWHVLPPKEKRKGLMGVILPFVPCMHPAAMKHPLSKSVVRTYDGTLID